MADNNHNNNINSNPDSSCNNSNVNVKEDGATSEENLSTSNENSDQTVKENEIVTVEVNERRPEEQGDQNEMVLVADGETSSSQKHHDDDSFEESSVKSSTYEFPTPPPPLCHVPPNSFEANSFEIPPDLINDMMNDQMKQNGTEEDDDDEYPKEYIVTFDEDTDKGLQRRNSCLSRGGSRSSIKKKVNYNESTEVIPSQSLDDHPHEEEEECDEVFSDSVPPMLPRGDMCTPFFTKRGSIPGLAALPDWFREEK